MRRMRFVALGIVSFVAVLMGALLAPGTFVNRALSTVLCTVFSFNWGACTANLAKSSDRVVAATSPAVERNIGDWLGSRSGEFDDDKPSTPPGNNRQVPPYPQQPGPNQPVRPEFDNPDSGQPNQTQPSQAPNRLTPGRSGGSLSNEPCNPTLVTASAEPGQQVLIKGVPENFVNLAVGVKVEGSNQISPSIATKLPTGELSVFVPLHPTRGALGGNVNIVIVSENRLCPGLSLVILPLTPSPGTTQKLFLKQQEFIDKIGQQFGVNRADLMSDTKNIPPELLPLAVAQFALDHPSNPNSFKAILAGTAPLLEGQAPDTSVLDSIIANGNMVSHLESFIKNFPKVNSNISLIPAPIYVASISDLKGVNLEKETRWKSGADVEIAFSLKETLKDMAKNREGLSRLCYLKGYTDTVQNDPFFALIKYFVSLFLVGISLTGVAAVPALGGSLGIFLLDKVTKVAGTLLPYEGKLTFQVDKNTLDTKNNKTGSWSQVKITTQSQGGSFDAGDMTDVILAALDLKGLAGELREVRQNIARLEKAVESSKQVLDDAQENYFKAVRAKQEALSKPGTGLTTEQMYNSGIKDAEINLQRASDQFQSDRNMLKQARQKQIAPGKEDSLGKVNSVLNEIRSFINKGLGIAENIGSIPIIPIAPFQYGEITLYEGPSDTTKFITASVRGSSISLGNQNVYQAVQSGYSDLNISSNLDTGEACRASHTIGITVTDRDERRQPNPPEPKTPTPTPNPIPIPPLRCTSCGDPHLTTLDGQRYDHQAVGEFVLTRTKNRQFEIQVREAPYKNVKTASINSAVAMKVGDARVSIYSAGFPDEQTNIPLRIDGKPVELKGTQNLPGGGSITQRGDTAWTVQWSTGEVATVQIQVAGDSKMIDISTGVTENDRGQMEGLLGNFNGNRSDDFMTRDGRVIEENKEAMNVARSVLSNFNVSSWIPIPLDKVTETFLDSLHREFGDSWRISQSESLFDYAPGKNTDSFTNRAFPNGFVILRMLSPQAVQKAEEACRKAEVPSDRLEDCLFDVAVTGEEDFASVAANILKNEVKKRVEQEIRNRIPLPVPLPF